MSTKKAAQRKGKHVIYYANEEGELVDWSPRGTQNGRPWHISYREWEEKYQDKLYLVDDPTYKAPPISRPSPEMREKIRKSVAAQRAAKAAKPLNKPGLKAELAPAEAKELAAGREAREKGLRTLIRKVARWEGSGKEEDRLEARSWASMVVELWPDTKDEVLAEFERGESGEEKEKTD